ncbi:MAG: EpsG family protein [Clostridia bacterium]|nr:EpsG family protein [Clostridia bacterium]
MVYLCLALFVYVCFALKNNKIIKTTLGNEIIVPAKEKEQKISWLAVVVLILFSGLRAHSVGGDISTYRIAFNEIGFAHSVENGYVHYEPFYKILNWATTLFGPTDTAFSVFLLIISIINVVLVVYVAKTISSDIALTMFLFVCVDIFIPSLSLLRQAIAISFIILSLKYVYEKKPLKFIICVIVAYFFHDSALLMLVLYLFNLLKNNKHNYYYYGFGFIILIVFAIFDEEIILRLCNALGFNYYWWYSMGGDKLSLLSHLKAISVVMVCGFFIAYKIYRDEKGKPLGKKYNLFLNIYYVAALLNIYNMIAGTLGIVSRMMYYFSWVLMLLVPEFLNSIENKKWKKIFTILMIVAGICYLSTTVVLRDQFGVNPYKTIFQV